MRGLRDGCSRIPSKGHDRLVFAGVRAYPRRMKTQRPEKTITSQSDFDSPAYVERFRELALAYTAEATVSKQAAIRTLQREGILTAKGKLTKRYSQK